MNVQQGWKIAPPIFGEEDHAKFHLEKMRVVELSKAKY